MYNNRHQQLIQVQRWQRLRAMRDASILTSKQHTATTHKTSPHHHPVQNPSQIVASISLSPVNRSHNIVTIQSLPQRLNQQCTHYGHTWQRLSNQCTLYRHAPPSVATSQQPGHPPSPHITLCSNVSVTNAHPFATHYSLQKRLSNRCTHHRHSLQSAATSQ